MIDLHMKTKMNSGIIIIGVTTPTVLTDTQIGVMNCWYIVLVISISSMLVSPVDVDSLVLTSVELLFSLSDVVSNISKLLLFQFIFNVITHTQIYQHTICYCNLILKPIAISAHVWEGGVE